MSSSYWYHFKLTNYSCIHVQGMKCCLQLNIQHEMIKSSQLTYPLLYFSPFVTMRYRKLLLLTCVYSALLLPMSLRCTMDPTMFCPPSHLIETSRLFTSTACLFSAPPPPETISLLSGLCT